MDQIWLWVGFNVFVLLMLALDLGVFHRKAHEISAKEAAGWSVAWVSLALLFNYGVYHFMGAQAGMEFLTGYLIEKALSVDNIFVFVLIFAVDSIPAIFAVTEDPFLVYTSNVFAILGLRSLYFLLAGVIHKFHYLKLGLSVVLVFVGRRAVINPVACVA
jgi:tellurite resistance protein TerC